MTTDKRNEHGPAPATTRHTHQDTDLIVTKISGKDIDLTIDRLSAATASYFRPGGLLMPKEPQSSQ
jgi:hypothetical protein